MMTSRVTTRDVIDLRLQSDLVASAGRIVVARDADDSVSVFAIGADGAAAQRLRIDHGAPVTALAVTAHGHRPHTIVVGIGDSLGNVLTVTVLCRAVANVDFLVESRTAYPCGSAPIAQIAMTMDTTVACSTTGTAIAIGNGTLAMLQEGGTTCAASGRYVALGKGRKVHCYEGVRLHWTRTCPGAVTSLAFASATTIVAGHADNSLSVYSAPGGDCLERYPAVGRADDPIRRIMGPVSLPALPAAKAIADRPGLKLMNRSASDFPANAAMVVASPTTISFWPFIAHVGDADIVPPSLADLLNWDLVFTSGSAIADDVCLVKGSSRNTLAALLLASTGQSTVLREFVPSEPCEEEPRDDSRERPHPVFVGPERGTTTHDRREPTKTRQAANEDRLLPLPERVPLPEDVVTNVDHSVSVQEVTRHAGAWRGEQLTRLAITERQSVTRSPPPCQPGAPGASSIICRVREHDDGVHDQGGRTGRTASGTGRRRQHIERHFGVIVSDDNGRSLKRARMWSCISKADP